MSGQVKPKFQEIGLLSKIPERGAALVFDIDRENFVRGFAIKFNGELYCYRNKCPHAGSELDWVEGQFFNEDGTLLICATHGAMFDPVSGRCVNGPCLNQSLVSVPVMLDHDVIFAWF